MKAASRQSRHLPKMRMTVTDDLSGCVACILPAYLTHKIYCAIWSCPGSGIAFPVPTLSIDLEKRRVEGKAVTSGQQHGVMTVGW